MGANHPGEITALCSIAEPGFGLITNIGLAHLEGFGSFEGVRKAKAELFDFLKDNLGLAFYNAGDKLLADLVEEKRISSIPFGDVFESICSGKITDSDRFLSVELDFYEAGKIPIYTKLIGSYNLENIVAACAVGKYFGVEPNDIKNAIEQYSPPNNRSQYISTKRNKVILDAYNANPSSMKASIMNFLAMKEPLEKFMILGDMLELGKFSQNEHEELLFMLEAKNIKNVYLVGPEFYIVSKRFHFTCFKSVEDLMEHFQKHPVNEHLIFLKGSRKIALEKLLEVL